MFGGRFLEVIVAESVDDGIDGCVYTHDIARRVQQGAQPIWDLFCFKYSINCQFFREKSKVNAHAIDAVAQDDFISYDDGNGERQVADEEANQNEEKHPNDFLTLGQLLQLNGRAGRSPRFHL